MTKQQLQARAAEIENMLDNSDETSIPFVEEELCLIYSTLRNMEKLEKFYD